MHIDGRIGLVTGAGTGIGEAIATALAENGVKIIVADIDTDGASETVDTIEAAGGSAEAVQLDVGDPERVSDCVDRVENEFGAIDILINNAGIAGPTAPVEDVSVAEWDRTLRVNLRGPFLLSRIILPGMKRREYGRIVNIASASAKRPVPYRAPYTASKNGLIGLTRTIAAEAATKNVNANAICPGSVEGPRIQRVIEHQAQTTGRPYEVVEQERRQQGLRKELNQPADVATLTTFLCSSAADRITGQAINVSAGKVVY